MKRAILIVLAFLLVFMQAACTPSESESTASPGIYNTSAEATPVRLQQKNQGI